MAVFDQNNNPVQGVLVQWSASGGGSVASATDPTDAGGQSIMEYTFGAVAGGQSGAVWRTFGTAGTFNYQCTNHIGMTGVVTVNP